MSPTQPEGTPDAVAKGAVLLASARGVAMVSGFILQLAMARMLGVYYYGLFGFIISILTWAELIHWGMSRMATLEVASEPGRAREWEKWFTGFQTIVAISIAMAGVGFSFFIPILIDAEGTATYFIIAFLDVPLLALSCLYMGLLNGLRNYKYQSISFVVYYTARLLFCVLLVALGMSLYGAVIGNVLCSVASLIVGLYYFRKVAPPLSLIPQRKKKVFRNSMPFVFTPLIFNVSLNVNLWLVGVFGGQNDLGIYNAAFSLSRVLFLLLSGLAIAVFPAITASLLRGDTERSRRLIKQSLRFYFLLIPPVLIYVVISADFLIKVFGGDYAAGAPYLRLLIIGFSLASILYLYNSVFLAGRHFRAVIGYNLLAVAAEILFSFLLVPHMGMEGFALAMIIALTVTLVPMNLSARSLFGAGLSVNELGRIFMAAAVSSLPLFFTHSTWATGAAYFLCAAIYLAALLACGELPLQEIKHWWRVISSKKSAD